MCWLTDWERQREALEEELFNGKTPPAPPADPPDPPAAAIPGPDEEPEEPAEEQGLLFDPGQPTCPGCGAIIDDSTMQTGKCYVCDETVDTANLVDVDEAKEPLDDQSELSFD